MRSSPDPEVLLLVVDVQQGFDAPRWGRRNNPAMETRVAELLHAIALADLHGEFATVADTESVLSVVRASR